MFLIVVVFSIYRASYILCLFLLTVSVAEVMSIFFQYMEEKLLINVKRNVWTKNKKHTTAQLPKKPA